MSKKPKTEIVIDPPKEELQKLESALAEFNALLNEKSEYQQLFDEANTEVETFSQTGNLRDTAGLSSVLVRQAQSSLVERRLGKINERLDAADKTLLEECKTSERLILCELYALRNGLAEKAALAMRENFSDLQEARRHGLRAPAVREVDHRISGLKLDNLALNLEAPEIALKLLEEGPKALRDVASIREELGGEIPSESELRAP